MKFPSAILKKNLRLESERAIKTQIENQSCAQRAEKDGTIKKLIINGSGKILLTDKYRFLG